MSEGKILLCEKVEGGFKTDPCPWCKEPHYHGTFAGTHRAHCGEGFYTLELREVPEGIVEMETKLRKESPDMISVCIRLEVEWEPDVDPMERDEAMKRMHTLALTNHRVFKGALGIEEKTQLLSSPFASRRRWLHT